MSAVLGVDSSLTITGCALVEWHPGTDFTGPRWQTWRARAAAPDVETVATNRRRIRVMLREILALVPARLDLSVVEGPAMSARHTPLADERAGLRWMLVDQLMARGPVALVAPTARQALSGVGVIPKDTKPAKRKQMVADAVRRMLPDVHVPDHNVADAVALAAAGAQHLGLWMPYTDKQITAHAKVAWPVETVADAAGMGMGK